MHAKDCAEKRPFKATVTTLSSEYSTSKSKVRFIVEFQDPMRKGDFSSYQILQTSKILYFPSCPSFLSISQVYHASCIVPQTSLLTFDGHARLCILPLSAFLSSLSYALSKVVPFPNVSDGEAREVRGFLNCFSLFRYIGELRKR